jgi:hypothetical protein
VKPALRRPLGVSTNTRRRCDIKITIENNGVDGRGSRLNRRWNGNPAPGEPGATGYVGLAY